MHDICEVSEVKIRAGSQKFPERFHEEVLELLKLS